MRKQSLQAIYTWARLLHASCYFRILFSLHYQIVTVFRYVNAANHCAMECPPEDDEMTLAGLTPVPSTKARRARAMKD